MPVSPTPDGEAIATVVLVSNTLVHMLWLFVIMRTAFTLQLPGIGSISPAIVITVRKIDLIYFLKVQVYCWFAPIGCICNCLSLCATSA